MNIDPVAALDDPMERNPQAVEALDQLWMSI